MNEDFYDEDIDKPLSSVAAPLNYLKVEDVPDLPESLDILNFHRLIPKGFDDQISVLLDGESIVIRCLKPENPDYTDVVIRPSLYNSEKAKTVVPQFLFEKSSVSSVALDYFKADRKLVLNINEFIYLLIAHRLTSFKAYNQQFVYLLQQDINNLANYLEYTPPVTFNAKAKAKNTFVIIPASAHTQVFPYGNFMSNCRPNEDEWLRIMRDIGKYVQPSSDSAMHKRAKIVLADHVIYRSVGYLPNQDGSFYCLFECKQNLPARLKTHYLGDAKRVFDADLSCFQQDCIISTENGEKILLSKDETLKKGIVVFAPIEWDTKRFIAGEAEVSANIADTLVVNTDSVNVSFVSKLGARVKHDIGVVVKVAKDQEIVLGYDDELEPVTLPQGVLSYTITKINQASTGGLSKLYFEAVMKAGNARIVSDTGLKFVSKVMTSLGTIVIPKQADGSKPTKFAPSVTQYLKDAEESSLAKYQRLDIDLDKFTEKHVDVLYPDVIVGMNAVKANTSEQCNTIVFAQAAFAVEYGYYTPSEKFGFKGLLNSHDVEEINRAAQSLPDFYYLDRFGKRQKVLIGLSHLKFTELGSVYTRFKPQSFAFTSAKNIHQNMPELAQHIYENYLEKDKVEIALELFKILNDPRGRLRIDDKIPRYTPKHIRSKKMFEEVDLILKKALNTNKQDSKLLDENWNKGFYLDLTSYVNGPLIRIPSAKTLNAFVGSLPDGTYSFHGMLVNISKMIQNIIGNANNKYNMSIGYLYNKATIGKKPDGKGRLSSYDLYMNTVQGALYSNEDSAMMIVQSLIKPKIKGVGMKQVVEPLLPDDVIVITDNRKYNRIVREANSNGELVIDRDELQALLDEDYDAEVDSLVNLAINDTSSKEDVDRILNDVPLVLSIRDPSLWELQLCRPRVWSRQHFALHLSRCSQPLDLDEYLSPRHNRDIVLVSSYVALASKSDCDGDRLPIFCLNGDGQALLKKFALNNVLKEEVNWINTYIKKEYESTKKLLIDTPEKHVYKLFKVSNVFDQFGDPKNYPQYIFNSQLAKGNIGPATIDMWALYMVFECYMAYCLENDYKHYSIDGKFLGNITQVLTEYDKKLLSFKQTELVQGNVIEAVKHLEGGSAAFKKYFLDGMTDTNNIDVVRKELTLPYEKGGYNMRLEDANLMLYIVKWAKEAQLLKAVKNFITKYNKGKLPAKPEALDMWEDFIQANTYFGGLIQPLFDIKRAIEAKNAELRAQAKAATVEEDDDLVFADL